MALQELVRPLVHSNRMLHPENRGAWGYLGTFRSQLNSGLFYPTLKCLGNFDTLYGHQINHGFFKAYLKIIE